VGYVLGQNGMNRNLHDYAFCLKLRGSHETYNHLKNLRFDQMGLGACVCVETTIAIVL